MCIRDSPQLRRFRLCGRHGQLGQRPDFCRPDHRPGGGKRIDHQQGAHRVRVKAVSYTHLDVYKRQEYELFRQAMHDRGHRLCTAKVVLLEELLGAVVHPGKRGHVPLSFLLPKFTPQERDKALVLMHQVFVFADMLYGAALELSLIHI